MVSETVVELSRSQFAINAVQHFLFVPLTVGISFFLLVLETWGLAGGRGDYRPLCRFWGKLFTLSFGLSLASSVAMLFQFGGNWSYFAHYAGDAFAGPVAVGVLAGLFTAANGLGWMLYGWDKLGRWSHLLSTFAVCLGCHLILFGFSAASGWMQYPVGAEFDAQAYRMELADWHAVLSNPVALAKFAHSLLSGYAVAAGFVLAISAYYRLRRIETALSEPSYSISAGLGLLAIIATLLLGDAGIYKQSSFQRSKLMAINGLPADDILAQNRQRIDSGIQAYAMLQQLRDDNRQPELLDGFAAAKSNLGYALLLKRWRDNVVDAGPEQIALAAQASLPPAAPLYWGHKVMVLCGVLALLTFLTAGFGAVTGRRQRWLLMSAMYALPATWLASGSGWFISEFGDQPWIVVDVLPTWLAVSAVGPIDQVLGLAVYGLAYSGLLALAILLAMQVVKQGTVDAPLPVAEGGNA
ncbi:cytochrome ubiquinol oxidase subunit I [Methylomonas sp. SURF-1]|uniref:Cytochrome ubiquinol oxidase subunit I n=1 Tax=Methylomonas aurea TaxID=2952224 RepID=A0ABT1ULX3_9GAMM|nr:cytochrome ubiquinol oxidase subunit I [Methylomonas sp. SURF-1]MCQ8183241.1 cytochrome ubiquinol oxidase subunit I [Methylomonas sp. SURF-1]